MRTTVTLDSDVQAGAETLRRQHQISLSQAVNLLARDGLNREGESVRPVFKQRVHALGLRVDVSNVSEALEILDGPDHP